MQMTELENVMLVCSCHRWGAHIIFHPALCWLYLYHFDVFYRKYQRMCAFISVQSVHEQSAVMCDSAAITPWRDEHKIHVPSYKITTNYSVYMCVTETHFSKDNGTTLLIMSLSPPLLLCWCLPFQGALGFPSSSLPLRNPHTSRNQMQLGVVTPYWRQHNCNFLLDL